MQFQPKTEEEVIKDQLCPEGLQPFTVMEASETVSKKSGKPMIKLKLNVHGDDGFDYHVYDYIADWFMAHKFRHFFFAVNRGQDYETGNVRAESYVDCEGYCDVGIGKAKDGFPAKETIRDYNVEKAAVVVKAAPAAAKSDAPTPAPEEDDVPF